jgi:putative YhbY family RNA-binding protein
MTELTLAKDFRVALKGQAHTLDPVVLLGAAGLTNAVVAEVDRALNAHSLIKVRVPLDDRSGREAIFADLADRLGAARVQAIGKLIVLYRPPPPEEKAVDPAPVRRGAPKKTRPVRKSGQKRGQR